MRGRLVAAPTGSLPRKNRPQNWGPCRGGLWPPAVYHPGQTGRCFYAISVQTHLSDQPSAAGWNSRVAVWVRRT